MQKKNTGFGLMEIIAASAVMVMVVLAVFDAFSVYIRTSKNNLDSVKASYLAEEGIEAVKIMRDAGWIQKISTITEGTAFRVGWNGTTWTSTSSSALIDGKFDRVIVLNNACRDGGTNSFIQCGTSDPNARKVSVAVSWRNNNATTTKVLETYITNLFEN